MTQRAFQIGVTLDASQAERELNDFEREIQDTQRELQGLGSNNRNLTNFGRRANSAADDVGHLRNEVGDLDNGFGSLGGVAGNIDTEMGGLSDTFATLGQTMFQSSQHLSSLGAELEDAENKLERMEGHLQALYNITGDTAEATLDLERNMDLLDEQMGVQQDEIRRLQRAYDAQNSTMARMGTLLRNTKVQIALVGIAAVAAASQMAKMTTQLVTLSQTDTSTFQTFAVATNKFGINAEQAANILKDFNDKVGDFVVTGGGPFVDVMERLGESSGLTAEKIASLSGPDGLVQLVSSMEKAQLSTQEQTFLLESLGSDLTLLLPLLKDNGAALRDITTDFDSLGQVVSKGALTNLTGVANEFGDTLGILKTLFLELAGAVAPVIEMLLGGLNKALVLVTKAVQIFSSVVQLSMSGLVNMAAWLADFTGFDDMAAELGALSNELRTNAEDSAQAAAGFDTLSGASKKAKENLAALNKLQNERSSKETGTIEKQIANQQRLAIAISQGTEAYEAEKRAIENTAAQEKYRKELQKQNLRPEQIDALVQQLATLQFAESSVTAAVEYQTEAEAKSAEAKADAIALAKEQADADKLRQESIVGVISGLQGELTILKATSDAERDSIKAKQDLVKLAKELNLSDTQIAKIQALQAQIIAQTAVNDATEEGLKLTETANAKEKARTEGIVDYTQSLNDELVLLNAKTDAQREQIAFEQKLRDLEANTDEATQLQAIHNQIVAQEEHNRVLKAQQEEYGKLGSAMTAWALDSEDAILKVIASLIQLIALQAGFDQNPFVQGFVGGLNGYAKGGTFSAGETFMVGEEGPEIMTARAGGTVIPNDEIANRIGQTSSAGTGSSSFAQNISLSINGSIVASEELDRKFEEFAGAVADNTQSLLRNQLRSGGVLA